VDGNSAGVRSNVRKEGGGILGGAVKVALTANEAAPSDVCAINLADPAFEVGDGGEEGSPTLSDETWKLVKFPGVEVGEGPSDDQLEGLLPREDTSAGEVERRSSEERGEEGLDGGGSGVAFGRNGTGEDGENEEGEEEDIGDHFRRA